MKFESKYGLGEIVVVGLKAQEKANDSGKAHDVLGEVIEINFVPDSKPRYAVRVTGFAWQSVCWYNECELDGDPDFDQEAGKYPQSE